MPNGTGWLPNPYFERLSRGVNFRLDFHSIEYFQRLGEPYGLSAEDMMYRYLRYIAGSGYTLDINEPTLQERQRLQEVPELEKKPANI